MSGIGIGLSQHQNPKEAVMEAVQQASQSLEGRSTLCIVFFTTHHVVNHQIIFQNLQETLQHDNISGCSASGVLAGSQEVTSCGLVVLLTNQIDAVSFSTRQTHRESASALQQLKEFDLSIIEQSQKQYDESQVMLVFPDHYAIQSHNIINSLNYLRSSNAIFGVSSCDDGSLEKASQIGGGTAFFGGLSGLLLKGIRRLNWGVTLSGTHIGDPLFITKIENNAILELDDFPVLEVFRTLAHSRGMQDLDEAFSQTLGAFSKQQHSQDFNSAIWETRPIHGVDVSNQGLILPQMIKPSDIFSFIHCSPYTAIDALETMLAELDFIDEKPSFGIYLNCAGRGEQLYQKPHIDAQAIQNKFGSIPLIGLQGSFQFARYQESMQLYVYTGILLLFYL